MKRIVYVAEDTGIDGLAKASVLYASFNEAERDSLINADPSKAWRTKGERIIDPAVAYKQALAKLDGVDRLVLGLKPWPTTDIPPTLQGIR
jgi:hypothetical protein